MSNENALIDLDMSPFQQDATIDAVSVLQGNLMTLGDLEAMSDEAQSQYWAQWEKERDGSCAACDPSGLGESGLSEILCKIWKFVLGIAKAVVDGVAGLLVDLSKAVYSVLKPLFEMVGDLAEDVFSSPGLLMLAGAALVLYLVISNSKGEETDRISSYREVRSNDYIG